MAAEGWRVVNDDDAVVVARFADVGQAEFARSVLEGHEIDAFIDTPYASGMFPHHALATRGVSLLVRAADEERALEVLASGG